MEGLEEDDSDYEQMIEDLCPDLRGPFEAWMAIIDKWPDQSEADALRQKLIGTELFYTVDGLADALADRCDWSYNHNSSKVHVAEGIRAIYKAFAPDEED
ncbi:hypothetical protein M422DRAFT_249946 [Sphaerobolus stellatus SS14]|nr:hypothetical protein M422DRAFT_249946 [Sphaerobolus stellatus SS14]